MENSFCYKSRNVALMYAYNLWALWSLSFFFKNMKVWKQPKILVIFTGVCSFCWNVYVFHLNVHKLLSTWQELHDSTMKSPYEMNEHLLWKTDNVRAPTKFQQNEHTPEPLHFHLHIFRVVPELELRYAYAIQIVQLIRMADGNSILLLWYCLQLSCCGTF